ncbi:TIGR03086 family metal-binding protein [Geodermatophilus sp. URMC 64]
MNTTATEYRAAHEALLAVLDRVPPSGWTSPSPCAGWTARDVVGHMIDTQRELLTGHGIDMGEAPGVDGDPAAAWRDHAERVAGLLADDAVPAIAYDGYFGPTTLGRTLEQFYVWDMLVHRWDVARAAGIDPALSEPELDRIEQGADSFGDALYMDGICTPGVEAPPGAGRAARLLARLGRAA